MKLIKRTYIGMFYWLLPVIVIGSIFCFYMIEYVAHEEVDEFLTYEMQRLTSYHKEHSELPEFHKVDDIYSGQQMKSPSFSDTMMLETGDNEMVPYRELKFSINHKGEYKIIVLRHLLLGTDDVFEGTVFIVVGLIALFSLFLIIILRNVTHRIWNPFYSTLTKLTRFNIKDEVPIFPKTAIDEFTQLNETVGLILTKISKDYTSNKEFTENISHELQTHLAIIRLNTEQLINSSEQLDANAIHALKKISSSSNDLVQIQKSLFLLSKIRNGEFNNTQSIDLNVVIAKIYGLFSEAIDQQGIQYTLTSQSCFLQMDEGLTEILINNLLKNALKYNVKQGFIDVELNANEFIIRNSGLPIYRSPKDLLKRFEKGKNGNSGLGLAIVSQICELYNFQLNYSVSEENVHELKISFHSA